MCTIETMEFFGVDDDVKIKVEYETHEDLDMNPDPHWDWKLNPNVECRVSLRRLSSKIIKQEYQGTLEGTDSPHFPEHVNHCLTIQRNIKEEPDDFEEDDKDPLGDLEPAVWNDCPTSTSLELKCESCEEIFGCFSDLIKHKSFHHPGDKEHKCETCGKCFAKAWMLKKHMTCHMDIKPFNCIVCEKSFSYGYTLNRHIESHHTTDKPQKCGECEKNFASISALNNHMIWHTKPHKCNLCEKSFLCSSLLKSHMGNRHSGEKPHNCGVCGKRFNWKNILKIHQRIHTREKEYKYKCSICKESFVSTSDLKTHGCSSSEKTVQL